MPDAKSRTSLCLLTSAAFLMTVACLSQPATAAEVYREKIQPFVAKYCIGCHNRQKPRGELDLGRYRQASEVAGDFRRWNTIIEFVRDGEMPPSDAKQPSLDERKAVADSIEEILLAAAAKDAGDPGFVPPRRLSHTEYDLSVRDLTGVDIHPTKEFPADPAGGEGFDNTGEALSMSPSLLAKYLGAARHVANHLVLKTDGISFASFPVTSYNERKKLTEQAIIDFYDRHQVRTADYLNAAWRYRYRREADRNRDIHDWASERGLSGAYLALVWNTLDNAASSHGFLKQIGARWNAVPEPRGDNNIPPELTELERFIEFCGRTLCHPRQQLIRSNAGNWPIGHLDFRAKAAAARDQFDPGRLNHQVDLRFDKIGTPKGDRQKAAEVAYYIRADKPFASSNGDYVLLNRPILSKSGNPPRNENDARKHEVVTLRSMLEQHSPALVKRLKFGEHPLGQKIDADSLAIRAPCLIEIPVSRELRKQIAGKHLLIDCQLDSKNAREGCVQIQIATGKPPTDVYAGNVELLVHSDSHLGKQLAVSAASFCNTFPNRFFYVDSRRGLAAGFHLVEGFFRDDMPLCKKVLNERQLSELDGLWEELHFVTRSAETLLRGFVWFERSERHVLHDTRFDFLRPEDPKLVDNQLLGKFERVYLEKLGVKLAEDSIEPVAASEKYDMIHGFFQQIRAGLSRYRQQLKAAEQQALQDVELLAERAYRRVLRPSERESLRSLYRSLRSQGQNCEEALRGVFTAVLMSPDFCYRFNESPAGSEVYPLSNDAMASRLSYFLWSSLPDDQLLDAARRGELQDEEQIARQARRMLKDPKIHAFAREFFAQWLRYRDYLTNDSIIPDAFPGYDDQLRQAMFEEPARLATYLIRRDKPITDLLNTDTTFVNGALARHYGGEIARQYQADAANWTHEFRRRGASPTTPPDQVWHQVNGLRAQGRGGLFGMGVILAKNSAGVRTSPVKRGFWTVHHLLGQHFPPPPAEVPELPTSEKLAEKSIRELLADHVADPQCAMCHVHFDGLGLALEGFDPIGRARTKDLAGRPVDNVATLPGGDTARGIGGLIEYIERHRREDFVRNFCRKFLGYALGRSVLLSDQPLLKEMEKSLESNDYRFSAVFETVVRSPQFRLQRGRDFVVTNH